jgi:hypothetical protein
MARIGIKLPRWSGVERECSVVPDGTMPWIPESGEQVDARVNGQKDEDSKLKDTVHTHGDKDWVATVALVPGRTRLQCWKRWQKNLEDLTVDLRGHEQKTKTFQYKCTVAGREEDFRADSRSNETAVSR